MQLFYRPERGVVGDMIPFFDDGVFKPFYLKDYRDTKGADCVNGWYMLTTSDHLHYQERFTGIQGGTGSVIKVDGLYHLFYCTFDHHPERNAVRHATSPDLETWTDLPEDAFYADGIIYGPEHWRDPFVFWNAARGEWWMLLAARKNGPTRRQGCTALCASKDLRHWEIREPFYAPMNADCAFECPDFFEWNGWYYLVYSSYADRYQTLYRMSRSIDGPWITPPVDTFDSRAFYAAKTAGDGHNRYVYGWNPTRERDEHFFDPQDYHGLDYNTWDWGGNLVVHKLVQHADGTLGVTVLDSVDHALVTGRPLKVQPLEGTWQTEKGTILANVENGCAYALLPAVLPLCKLETTVVFREGTRTFGVAVQVDQAFADGYMICFEPNRGRIQLVNGTRTHEPMAEALPYEVEIERPIQLLPDTEYAVRLFVQGTVLEVYVGDEIALSARMYDWRERNFGLYVEQGTVEFRNVQLLSE